MQHVATFHILFRPSRLKELPDGAGGNRLRMQPQLRYPLKGRTRFITGTQGSFPRLPNSALVFRPWCPMLLSRGTQLSVPALKLDTHSSPVLLAETPHDPCGHSWPYWLQIHSHHSLSDWVTQVDLQAVSRVLGSLASSELISI